MFVIEAARKCRAKASARPVPPKTADRAVFSNLAFIILDCDASRASHMLVKPHASHASHGRIPPAAARHRLNVSRCDEKGVATGRGSFGVWAPFCLHSVFGRAPFWKFEKKQPVSRL